MGLDPTTITRGQRHTNALPPARSPGDPRPKTADDAFRSRTLAAERRTRVHITRAREHGRARYWDGRRAALRPRSATGNAATDDDGSGATPPTGGLCLRATGSEALGDQGRTERDERLSGNGGDNAPTECLGTRRLADTVGAPLHRQLRWPAVGSPCPNSGQVVLATETETEPLFSRRLLPEPLLVEHPAHRDRQGRPPSAAPTILSRVNRPCLVGSPPALGREPPRTALGTRTNPRSPRCSQL